jgi:NAD(P)-dependent dehydrogenase (short-subunit alcohol dehydrogenase family)
MTVSVSGRRVLVTGASAGLGRHMALALAREGAEVAAAARRAEALDALAAEGARFGALIRPVPMDVADPASVSAGVAAAAAALGGLDGLVANAGVARAGPALDATEADWRATMSVNLDGVFRTAQAAARVMAAGQGGAIVTVASILGFGVAKGVAAYAASKAAVVHLTKALALEWAAIGVRVNALAPGYIPTDLNRAWLDGPQGEALKKRIPLRRLGEPRDLDGPLMLLLSDAGRYVTGVTIPVDGGHLVAPL